MVAVVCGRVAIVVRTRNVWKLHAVVARSWDEAMARVPVVPQLNTDFALAIKTEL